MSLKLLLKQHIGIYESTLFFEKEGSLSLFRNSLYLKVSPPGIDDSTLLKRVSEHQIYT